MAKSPRKKSAKTPVSLEIRPYGDGDRDALLSLWEACDLVKPWNDPERDIALFSRSDCAEVLVGCLLYTSPSPRD